jgi:ABC-type phosphate transport system substrate-binding protein
MKAHKILIKNFLFVFFFILFVQSLSYGQISVIVSSSSSHKLSKDEAKEIFSGSKTTWSNGSKVEVVDQSESEVGKKFYDSFLGKAVNQVRVQWTKLILSGQAAAPVKAANDEAVKKNVSGSPNAVGYISSKSLDSSVKELFKIE